MHENLRNDFWKDVITAFKDIQDNSITLSFLLGEMERAKEREDRNVETWKNANIIYLNVHVIGHCI